MPTELTKAQKERMQEYVRKWTEIGLCTDPADRPRAEAGIRLAYQAVGLPVPERIIWCGSPISGALARALIGEPSLKDRIWNSATDDAFAGAQNALVRADWSGIWSQTRELFIGVFGVWNSVWTSAERSMCRDVRREVREGVMESARKGVEDIVSEAVLRDVGEGPWGSIWVAVWRDLGSRVARSLSNLMGNALYGQHDAAGLAHYEFYREVCGLREQTEGLAGLWEIARSAGWIWPCAKVAIACERTSAVRKNAAGQLHCDGGAAVEYPDGWRIYALNGVVVPGWLAETPPERLDARQILQVENVDQRREGIRRVGMTRLIQQLEPQVLDTLFDYELLAVEMGHGAPWRFLKMVNPSIGCVHIEAVPRECETIQHALNWRRSQNIDYGWFPAQLT